MNRKARTTVKKLIDWVQGRRPVRVFVHYNDRAGPLFAAGMSYQALFAVFAGIWVGFTIFGFILLGQPELRAALVQIISTSVPGLLGPDGAISETALFTTQSLSWAGSIALIGLLFTALTWLAFTRRAIRRIFERPNDPTFFLLLKLKDLGLALAFGFVLILSAVLSLVSTGLLGATFALLGISNESAGALIAARVASLGLMFVLDTATLAMFYRVLSGIRIPNGRLLRGALIGAAALGIVKALGGLLLGGVDSNPLLSSFAVVIGLLIWFNLVCQIILITAAWIAVGLQDAGIELRPRTAAAGPVNSEDV
jgi:membrane protein